MTQISIPDSFIVFRPRYHELIYVVIEELLAIKTLDPVSRALTLLDKTQLLWLSRREDEM